MGDGSPEARDVFKRHWFGVRWPVLVVAICVFMAWGVVFGPQTWKDANPLHLIQRGTALERRKAALDLGEAIGERDIDDVIRSLINAMADTDVDARAAAADSLSSVVHKMLRRPASTPAEQTRYEKRLAFAVAALTEALKDPDPGVRKPAAFGLGFLREAFPSYPPPELIAAMSDESELVRKAARDALHGTRLTLGLLPGLKKALESSRRDVRFEAAEVLGTLGKEAQPAVPALLEILKEPFDRQESEKTHVIAWKWDPACAAAKSLGQIGASPEILAALIAMLSSDVDERLMCTAEGLATLAPEGSTVLPALMTAYDRTLTSGEYSHGPYEISRRLGELAPHSASEARVLASLIRALGSKSGEVRLGAIEALAKFGERAADAKPKLRELERNDTAFQGIISSAAKATLAAIEGKRRADRPEG